jgi:hypothetical protein
MGEKRRPGSELGLGREERSTAAGRHVPTGGWEASIGAKEPWERFEIGLSSLSRGREQGRGRRRR